MAFFGVEIKHFRSHKYLRIRNKLFDLAEPKIIGIINSTPDSFFKDSRALTSEEIERSVNKMIHEGVDIIDIGACSTRPGAELISEEEELNRVIPAITLIKEKFPELIISIDTFRAKVAEQGLIAGADIINDVTGGDFDPNIWTIAAKFKAPYILMHSRGNSKTMHDLSNYDHVSLEILLFLSEKIKKIKEAGIKDIIIDLGFGFAKNEQQNYQLMADLELFDLLEFPILIGISRKSMIYNRLNIAPEEALNGTTVLHTYALSKNANFLRVHDVKEAVEIKTLLKLDRKLK
jgi:dihydropteroate synthase